MLTPFTQRWRAGRSSYRPAGETINTRLYEVAEIMDDSTARDYVIQNHYSHSYPAARRRFGLYRSEQLCGVAVFSHPSNDRALTSVFPGAATDSLELGRFILDQDVPANGESWFFARCRDVLRRDGFIGILSFSDDTPRTDAQNRLIHVGHVGTIYCASSGIYTGRATARTLRLLPDGRVFSPRTIQKIRSGERGWLYASNILVQFGATEPPVEADARRSWLDTWCARLTRPIRHMGNHRYLWALQKGVRLPASLPYPKLTARQLQPALF